MNQFSAYAFVMRISVEIDKSKLGLFCKGEILCTMEIVSFYFFRTLNAYFIDVNIRRHSIIKQLQSSKIKHAFCHSLI